MSLFPDFRKTIRISRLASRRESEITWMSSLRGHSQKYRLLIIWTSVTQAIQQDHMITREDFPKIAANNIVFAPMARGKPHWLHGAFEKNTVEWHSRYVFAHSRYPQTKLPTDAPRPHRDMPDFPASFRGSQAQIDIFIIQKNCSSKPPISFQIAHRQHRKPLTPMPQAPLHEADDTS